MQVSADTENLINPCCRLCGCPEETILPLLADCPGNQTYCQNGTFIFGLKKGVLENRARERPPSSTFLKISRPYHTLSSIQFYASFSRGRLIGGVLFFREHPFSKPKIGDRPGSWFILPTPCSKLLMLMGGCVKLDAKRRMDNNIQGT
jgi:hypothetical protein